MSLLQIFGGQRKSAKRKAQKLSVGEANAQVASGAVLLVDVREPHEWQATGRPWGSYGIALQAPDFEAQLLDLVSGDKSAPVAFSCKAGSRSAMAIKKAIALGLSEVADVDGGFLAWEAAGLPIDKVST
ncbi:MAG: rhodanese-like domain-containing protein [Pseudomonadota bacterium]